MRVRFAIKSMSLRKVSLLNSARRGRIVLLDDNRYSVCARAQVIYLNIYAFVRGDPSAWAVMSIWHKSVLYSIILFAFFSGTICFNSRLSKPANFNAQLVIVFCLCFSCIISQIGNNGWFKGGGGSVVVSQMHPPAARAT